MLRVHSSCLWTGLAVIAAVVGGCSRDGFESSVSGSVKLDGKSIGPGVVVFAPVGVNANPATGTINANGDYSLLTSRTAGLAPGKYQVSVSVREMPANLQPGDRPPPGKLLIPEKFASSATSGLEFEVKPGSNRIDIPLDSN